MPHALPPDLKLALAQNKSALSAWQDITPLARNEFICWVISPKKVETRAHRIKTTIQELNEGKRRPCCWAGCIHR
jgi:uncharacterized protein YdeI (YjbR/CyaY-like superfamily)